MSGIMLSAGDASIKRLPFPGGGCTLRKETHVKTVSVGNESKLCDEHIVSKCSSEAPPSETPDNEKSSSVKFTKLQAGFQGIVNGEGSIKL